MKKSDKESKMARLWLLVGSLAGIFGSVLIWGMSLKEYMIVHESRLVKNLAAENVGEDEKPESDFTRKIRYIGDGVYLLDDKDEVICGPYKSIEIEDVNMYSKICRFIGSNGLIGYLSAVDGEVVISPQFVQASEMEGGITFVRDEKEGYYLNDKGERVTNNEYLYGFPFSELQGLCARVQMPDGTFAIIDREEDILLESCERINELPGALTYGSAIKDGKAILFEFIFGEEMELEIIKEYGEYCDISEVYMEGFAIVENEQGLKGAVCAWNGEVIIPVEYKSLEIEYLQTEEEGKENVLFKLQNKNNKYENFIWEN